MSSSEKEERPPLPRFLHSSTFFRIRKVMSSSSSSSSGGADRVLRCCVLAAGGQRVVRLRVAPGDSVASLAELAAAKLRRKYATAAAAAGDERDAVVGLRSQRLERGGALCDASRKCGGRRDRHSRDAVSLTRRPAPGRDAGARHHGRRRAGGAAVHHRDLHPRVHSTAVRARS